MRIKVGDKVETTKAHDQHFDSHEEGIIERVDGDYIELYTRTGEIITMHIKWVQPHKGDINWFYKGKLI